MKIIFKYDIHRPSLNAIRPSREMPYDIEYSDFAMDAVDIFIKYHLIAHLSRKPLQIERQGDLIITYDLKLSEYLIYSNVGVIVK